MPLENKAIFCVHPPTIIAWGLLMEHYLLPEDSAIVHMLWAMHFLCCYPKQEECCAAAGTQEKGAVNP